MSWAKIVRWTLMVGVITILYKTGIGFTVWDFLIDLFTNGPTLPELPSISVG